MNNIRIISASAGSGKTYRLVEVLCDEITAGRARPEAVIATTFTRKAAAELRERAGTALIKTGHSDRAFRLGAARMGTINAVCGRLVTDFAFEKGLFTQMTVVGDDMANFELDRAMAPVIDRKRRNELIELNGRLETFDWRQAVERIMEHARHNNFGPEDLMVFKERSIDSCLNLFGDPEEGDHDRELAAALAGFLDNANEDDTTKKTREALNQAEQALRTLESGGRLKWSDWIRLANLSPGAKSRPLVQAINQIGSKHDVHPRLRQDMERAVAIVYDIAAEALDHYQEYKRQWGLMDYADQEVMALELLKEDFVRERLRGELDLLLVDEFQDTSPIQLAILLQLSTLTRQTVWVGDQKQSIYGFRGTDPSLMDACIQTVCEGHMPETLKYSWRSCPRLVELTSEIFSRAFKQWGVPKELVWLDSAPPIAAKYPLEASCPVEYWELAAGNQEREVKSLAAGIKRFLKEDSIRIRDKETGQARPIRPGDIGILCRTNRIASRVADELALLNIGAALPRKGLLDTAEAIVVQAGLSLWVDSKDALAAAELARVVHFPDRPDDFLETVINNQGMSAFEALPEVEKILKLSRENRRQGAVSVLDSVMDATNVRELCLAWGDSGSRLANLENLRAYAVRYAEECESSGRGATPAGLSLWFVSLKENSRDETTSNTGANAVQIVTWHSAKGLEWPVVVLFETGYRRAPDPTGVHVIGERETFDFSDPLAGRWVRYWPYPYHSRQSKNIPMLQRLMDERNTKVINQKAGYQDLRLLYVAWTRARDLLVITSREKELNKGIMKVLSDDKGLLLSQPENGQAIWGGRKVEITGRLFEAMPAEVREPHPGCDYAAPGPQPHPPARLAPSGVKAAGELGRPEWIGDRIPISGAPDMDVLGQAVHLFFSSDPKTTPRSEREELATRILQRWEIPAALPVKSLVQTADNFYSWIEEKWKGSKHYREWPIWHMTEKGTVISGYVDLALETNDGYVIIDHKTFPGNMDMAMEAAGKHGGQLATYAEAVSMATGKPTLGCYIHFPVSGLIVQVDPVG